MHALRPFITDSRQFQKRNTHQENHSFSSKPPTLSVHPFVPQHVPSHYRLRERRERRFGPPLQGTGDVPNRFFYSTGGPFVELALALADFSFPLSGTAPCAAMQWNFIQTWNLYCSVPTPTSSSHAAMELQKCSHPSNEGAFFLKLIRFWEGSSQLVGPRLNQVIVLLSILVELEKPLSNGVNLVKQTLKGVISVPSCFMKRRHLGSVASIWSLTCSNFANLRLPWARHGKETKQASQTFQDFSEFLSQIKKPFKLSSVRSEPTKLKIRRHKTKSVSFSYWCSTG